MLFKKICIARAGIKTIGSPAKLKLELIIALRVIRSDQLKLIRIAITTLRVLKSESRILFTKKEYADVELRVPKVQKAYDLLLYIFEL